MGHCYLISLAPTERIICFIGAMSMIHIIDGIDLTTIQKYIQRKVSLRDLILMPTDGFVYIADIDENIQYGSIYLLLNKEIPSDYIPQEDSYYDFER